MAILPTHPLHADNPNDVANGSFLAAVVEGPSDVNRLLIFTGTAILNFPGPTEDQSDTTNVVNLEIILMQNFTSQFDIPKGISQWSATYVSLASEGSVAGSGDNDEWLFDTGENPGDISTFLDNDQALKLRATLVAGTDSNFNRVAYQASVLAVG